jgi:cation diffusion facilitator CzcD-associated flavoprotein CzcO
MHTAADDCKAQSPSGVGTAGGHTMDICIIGGGVSGLSALQVIMGTPQHKSGLWKSILFEARDKTGGVW